MAARRRVHLIATGGTIAGTAPDPTDTRRYTAGVLSAEQLLASVPAIAELADITVQQLYNLDSKDMTPEHWLGLARATQAALARDDVDSVVITHGTDTMEESAFFLDLVLPPGKPVVFTGAMRPATALSADGPMNLLDAVTVAASTDAKNLGVVVVMQSRIHAARDVTKTSPLALSAFSSGEAGVLGSVPPVRIVRRPDPKLPMDFAAMVTLPRVDVLWVGAGSDPDLATAAIAAGARGLVLALPGNGSLPAAWASVLPAVQARGVPVIRSSRCLEGGAFPGLGLDMSKATVGSYTPAKLRVALMLALASSPARTFPFAG